MVVVVVVVGGGGVQVDNLSYLLFVQIVELT